MGYNSVDDQLKPIKVYHQKPLLDVTKVEYILTAPSGTEVDVEATILTTVPGVSIYVPAPGDINELGLYKVKTRRFYTDGRILHSRPQVLRIEE